ncbi:MAG: IS630 family transposase, partial [Nitrospiraceae bacterium]
HRAREFRRFLDRSEAAVPATLDVHLVLENEATPKPPLIPRWPAKRPRFHLHLLPPRASWLHLVERRVAMLTAKQLRRGVHRSTRALAAAITQYRAAHNEAPKPFVWTKTADEILASIQQHCERISDSRQ